MFVLDSLLFSTYFRKSQFLSPDHETVWKQSNQSPDGQMATNSRRTPTAPHKRTPPRGWVLIKIFSPISQNVCFERLYHFSTYFQERTILIPRSWDCIKSIVPIQLSTNFQLIQLLTNSTNSRRTPTAPSKNTRSRAASPPHLTRICGTVKNTRGRCRGTPWSGGHCRKLFQVQPNPIVIQGQFFFLSPAKPNHPRMGQTNWQTDK